VIITVDVDRSCDVFMCR